MSTPPGVLSGQFAGRYSVERVIGRGATAIVHLARDTHSGASVAIKVLRPEVADSSTTGRFLKEIRRTSSLHHPHILPVLDSGEHDGKLYFVLPYMEGGTLRDLLTREKTLELDAVLRIAQRVGEALDHAHKNKLIHRDVKPENILFSNGEACLGDFGIARALELSGSDTSTSRTTIRGTAAYMSPEQAAGGEELDARSDIYSLACVVYEMITGMQAFIGPTATAVISMRLVSAPRDVRVYRPSVPAAVDAVLAKAFAITPADRYRSAGAFVTALETAVLSPAPPVPRRRRRVLIAACGAVVASALAPWFTLRGPSVDPAVHLVLPFSFTGPASSPALDGAATATHAYDALRRWPDVLRVDPFRVNDLLIRQGGAPASLTAALKLARSARAGHLLWGEVHAQDGKTIIRGVLYDVANPDSAPREARVVIPAGTDDSLDIRFATLVDSLMAGGQPRPRPGSTRRFAAVGAYAAGVSALNGWDLRAAQQQFRTALEIEPNYPAANLRLSQVSQWLQTPAAQWRPAAAAAASSNNDLSENERLHASALLAMADADYDRACQHYGRLNGIDSLDFATWFGLGECRLQDRLVIRDSTSVSGWRFRSSRKGVADAYTRAFELVPTSYRAYKEMIASRLERVFITRTGAFRDGVAAEPARAKFGAFPELVADTIAFVPYPIGDLTRRLGRPQATVNAALEQARQQLVALSDQWVKINPESPSAWEARAQALEGAGMIAGHHDRSAIGSIGRARRLATEAPDSIRFGAIEVKLRIMSGQFRSAGRLADSLVTRFRDPEPEIAGSLASLSGLLGRLGDMEHLLERAAPLESSFVDLDHTRVNRSPGLADLALRLMANAALTGPRDTIDALERRIEHHLASIADLGERSRIRGALTRVPAMLSFPAIGARPAHADTRLDYLLGYQARISRGDTAAVHHELVSLLRQRDSLGVAPGSVSVESIFLEASMLAHLGDTEAAAAHLDGSLDNLSAQSKLFAALHRPATLVSAMELRATLATRSGDLATARRWRVAVNELRGTGDERK